MKTLMVWTMSSGFLLDTLGVVGLGLLGLAAAKLAKRHHSWGGSLMAFGAIALLIGRLWVLLSPAFFTPAVRASLGRETMGLLAMVPTALLTLGLAGVVWGLWGHDRWLRESGVERR